MQVYPDISHTNVMEIFCYPQYILTYVTYRAKSVFKQSFDADFGFHNTIYALCDKT